MIQLVELVTVDNENLAYHYASDDIDAVFNYEKKFNDLTKDEVTRAAPSSAPKNSPNI